MRRIPFGYAVGRGVAPGTDAVGRGVAPDLVGVAIRYSNILYGTYSTQFAAAGIAVPAGILSSNNLVLQMKIKKPAAYILPDTRPWKVRHRVDIRKREGRQREDFRKRNRDRKGYKRPDAGKRPKTHRGASGSSRKHTVVPFKRRLRSKTKADECKEHADDKGDKCITDKTC